MTMTGGQLKQLIDQLHTSAAEVARQSGYSRQYVSRLADLGQIALPEDAFRAIRSALLAISKEAAAVYFDLTGDFREGDAA